MWEKENDGHWILPRRPRPISGPMSHIGKIATVSGDELSQSVCINVPPKSSAKGDDSGCDHPKQIEAWWPEQVSNVSVLNRVLTLTRCSHSVKSSLVPSGHK